ncbi:hypothetical protein COU36_04885 [Candidatus Micrarchaeota archaeon CG10_big_fil_rev_8_21_14_0_10_59_7]|nr:MAG: hypothetical protein COU36_04885 [Candidatus Micrarchaeota archaeon CG10_big_fil_rev_8_21_14_0_10_59_7]
MNADEEYLLGAMGDAYLDVKRSELQFYQKDVSWLEDINEILDRLFGLKGKIFKRDVFWLRKRNKRMAARIVELRGEEIVDGKSFVAGLFDSEGSFYLSSKSKIPVADITQCDKGLKSLEIAKRVLDGLGIKCVINGPYNHKHAKRPQFHLRIYGAARCGRFFEEIPLKHRRKIEKFMSLSKSGGLQTLTLLR